MITGNYNLTPTVEWRQVQLEDQFLECDTTLGDVNIFLPDIADLERFWTVRIHIINKVGANKVNLIAFTTLLPAPVTNFINGVALVSLTNVGDSTICFIEDETNWLSTASGSSVGIPTVVAALAQAALATATYTSLPVGSSLAVVDYDATGDGCTLVKTTLANNTFADWIIVATDLVASTGGIGKNPI
jgi:hypothetical protein